MYWNDPYFIYDPFERILIKELIGRVLDVLTEKQKVVFLEHCIYGKKQSQIADKTDYAKVRIIRGKRSAPDKRHDVGSGQVPDLRQKCLWGRWRTQRYSHCHHKAVSGTYWKRDTCKGKGLV